jgi:hypothetical protein
MSFLGFVFLGCVVLGYVFLGYVFLGPVCVPQHRGRRIIRIVASSAELKLAYSFGLQERTFFISIPTSLASGWNAWTNETFHGNGSGGEYRPSQYKDSVPWFQAAQDEDGETFKANQAFRRNSQVVFALPTFAIYAAIHQCGRQTLPFKSLSPPPAPLLTKPVWLSKVLDIHIPPPILLYKLPWT